MKCSAVGSFIPIFTVNRHINTTVLFVLVLLMQKCVCVCVVRPTSHTGHIYIYIYMLSCIPLLLLLLLSQSHFSMSCLAACVAPSRPSYFIRHCTYWWNQIMTQNRNHCDHRKCMLHTFFFHRSHGLQQHIVVGMMARIWTTAFLFKASVTSYWASSSVFAGLAVSVQSVSPDVKVLGCW